MADEVRDRETDPRSLASKPFEELDDAAGSEQPTKLAAAKRAAAATAAAALVGALAGAAKAYADRRSSRSAREEPDDDDTDVAGDETGPSDVDEAEAQQAEQEEQEGDEEHTDDAPEAEAHEPPDAEPETEDDDGDDPDPAAANAHGDADHTRGAPASEAASIVKQARSHLQSLIGAEAESVSALQRTNGTWKVTLEVVELHRVPESTDVLSSYDVVVDDDGDVVSLTRGRRYRRSQVEEDR